MSSTPRPPLTTTERLSQLGWQRTLLVAAVVGTLGALCTIGFRETIFAVERWVFGRSGSLVGIASGLVWWQRLLSPAVGGVLAGLLLAWARRHTQPTHTGDYMEAVTLGSGDLDVRSSLLRALSSTATVASGGAIGREGPMVQLAALAGSLVGRWRELPVPRRRLYVACGAAAGIATAYNAPITGALFVAEIVLHSLAMVSLAPLLVAAVAANLVVRELAGYAPVYQMPAIALTHELGVLALAALGLLAGLLAPAYLALLDRAHAAFRQWRSPLWLKLGAGGLLVGALSLVSPAVWGNGYSVVNAILQGHWVWQALLLILVLKLLAVAATTGSGAVGGIFTPTLFVGAVVGALFGGALQALWPDLIPVPAAVAIGMGAFLAACTHAPLMSILMIFEMTESYSLIVPLMAACVLAYSVSRTLHVRSIYETAEGNARPAPTLAMAADLIQREPPTIRAQQSLRELEQVFQQRRWQNTYVVDEAGRFLGAISLHDARTALQQAGELDHAWPPALLRTDYPRVRATAAAWQVMEVFIQHPGERLPVLDEDDHLLGYVTKSDLVTLCRDFLAAT